MTPSASNGLTVLSSALTVHPITQREPGKCCENQPLSRNRNDVDKMLIAGVLIFQISSFKFQISI